MGREGPIQRGCMDELKQWDAVAICTLGGTVPKGFPDIIACWRGMYLAIEVKRPGGILSRIQAHRLKMLERAGARVLVVESRVELRQWLIQLRRELLDQARSA